MGWVIVTNPKALGRGGSASDVPTVKDRVAQMAALAV